jgi:hypothetical protein
MRLGPFAPPEVRRFALRRGDRAICQTIEPDRRLPDPQLRNPEQYAVCLLASMPQPEKRIASRLAGELRHVLSLLRKSASMPQRPGSCSERAELPAPRKQARDQAPPEAKTFSTMRTACRNDRELQVELSIPALARRPEQIEQKPHRHDHQRAEQQIGQRPGKTFAGQFLDALGRQPRGLHQLFGGNAEMRQDRADDQRGDQHLDQSAREAVEHFAPVAGGKPALIRARES